MKKTLASLEAIHLSQSGALLMLLVDKFLHTHHLSVSRICDSTACRRVEMLLAESVEVRMRERERGREIERERMRERVRMRERKRE